MKLVFDQASGGRMDRIFYTGMAIVIAVTIFAGFAPTFYLRGYLPLPPFAEPMTPLLVAHDILATSWIVLFLLQTTLIAFGKIRVHRRMGIFGSILAAAMVVAGIMTAIDALRRGSAPPGIEARTWFFSVPLSGILIFGALVTSALLLRHRPEAHKQLMLLATIDLTGPALGRMAGQLNLHGVAFLSLVFGPADVLIFIALIYAVWTRGRARPALMWASIAVLSRPLLIAITNTPFWVDLADKLR
jgi:hypothetical protein